MSRLGPFLSTRRFVVRYEIFVIINFSLGFCLFALHSKSFSLARGGVNLFCWQVYVVRHFLLLVHSNLYLGFISHCYSLHSLTIFSIIQVSLRSPFAGLGLMKSALKSFQFSSGCWN